jgi:pyridoxal phosphate enzyme (YggS family)
MHSLTEAHPVPDALQRLSDNVAGLTSRVEAARRRGAHASPAPVSLVVVTKSAPVAAFDLLLRAGHADVGENRVLDAERRRERASHLKIPERRHETPAGGGLVWHGIGHLQTNKARRALFAFDVFHALDSLHLADRLEALLSESDRRWPVYAQVNAAEDPAKGGVAPAEALAYLRALATRSHLDVVGLMAMAREDAPADAARRAFSTLRAIRDEAVRLGVGRRPPAGLSMGMSDDFETAVEEGATVVRIGRAGFKGVFDGADPSGLGR